MNYLVHIPSGLPSPELEILLSKSQEIIDKKSSLYIVTCSGLNNYACSLNPYSIKVVCFACKNRLKNGLKKLTGNFNLIETPKISSNIINNIKLKRVFYNINKKNNLKFFFYQNTDLGMATYSSYLALIRDIELKGFLSRHALSKILLTGICLTDFYDKFFKHNQIKEVFLYNGRQSQSRPVLRMANLYKIKTSVLEHTTVFANSKGVRNFENNLPQSISFFSKKVRLIKNSSINKNKKKIYNFFKYKKIGLPINSPVNKSFVKNQSKYELPADWDVKKKNIVFFTTSEDEYTSIGGIYDKLRFGSQTDIIIKICKLFDNNPDSNFQFWIRTHPNLQDVKWEYNKILNKIANKYKNIHFISADSKISTYQLMENAEKVLVFSSTIAVEAAYANKVCILLGRTFYENLGFCYIPKNFLGLQKLIFSNNLKVKKNINLYKWVVFWIESGISQKHFSGNHKKGYKFKHYTIKSSYLSNILNLIGKFLIYKVCNNINFYFRVR
jgi:hypothetical protein